MLARFPYLSDRIDLLAELFRELFLGKLSHRLVVVVFVFSLLVAVKRHGLFLGFRHVEDFGVDVKGSLRIAEFVEQNLFVIEGVLDPRGRFGPVGHGDHDRRRAQPLCFPCFRRFEPVLSKQDNNRPWSRDRAAALALPLCD